MISLDKIDKIISWHYINWFLYPLHDILQKRKISKIQKKEIIRVLFVLIDLGQWKTEPLFLKMLEHPRFEPILGLATSLESPSEKEKLAAYFKKKKYNYVDLEDKQSYGLKPHNPDIVFFQKPYSHNYKLPLTFRYNQDLVYCYCPYGTHTFNQDWNLKQAIKIHAWQNYYENEQTYLSVKREFPQYSKNIVVTGLPFNDSLLLPKEKHPNPWKQQKEKKKRIIYAPHHSLAGDCIDSIEYSTFLKYCEFMLEMAKKYKNETQWAFKPHPFLKSKLIKLWGEEKTNTYYEAWEELENAQLEVGEYKGLFKHSDAMIHDCGSFTIEYHYTQNPVLYLTNGKNHTEGLNSFAKEAFDLHYLANCENEIERFIRSIISEEDPLKIKRQVFFSKNLLPPNGKTACDNIINSILGIEEYKR